MTLSSFRAFPRRGHLERMKRVYGYLSKFKHAILRIRPGMPDLSDVKIAQHDWNNSPYAGAREDLPKDVPPPRGKPVRIFSYGDANLMHKAIRQMVRPLRVFYTLLIKHHLIGIARRRIRWRLQHMEQKAVQLGRQLNK